jgi:type III secretion system YscD/HrpQ family protein
MTDQVLKVLSGNQIGVEVSLDLGEYTIGSSEEDDLRLLDVSLRPGHLRLRVRAGESAGQTIVELAGGSGNAFVAVQGDQVIEIEPGDDSWQPLEPLTKVTMGAISFAVGPADSPWHTVGDKPARRTRAKRGAAARDTEGGRRWSVAGFASTAISAGTALLLGLAIWLGFEAIGSKPASYYRVSAAELEAEVRAAVDQFDFARDVTVSAEVDGTFDVGGYVDRAPERRAIRQALDETGATVRERIYVRNTILSQARGYLESEGLREDIDVALSPDGVLTLSGTVLDPEVVARVTDFLSTELIGPREVVSEIRTLDDVLEETRVLAGEAAIDDTVIFQLNGDVIEATGVVYPQKVDAWVGFLQAYSRRFADLVGLRSYVYLAQRGEEGGETGAEAVSAPLVIGLEPGGEGEVRLDADALSRGEIGREALFAAPDGIPGLTEKAILALARKHNLDRTVSFTIDGNVLEATGVVFPQNVEGWARFLRELTERFGERLVVRSFVSYAEAETLADARLIVSRETGNRSGEPVVIGDPRMIARNPALAGNAARVVDRADLAGGDTGLAALLAGGAGETVSALLAEARRLLEEAGIAGQVLLREEDGALVADGTIYEEDMAAWLAFLQRFLEEHGDEAELRSRVVFGGRAPGDRAVDWARNANASRNGETVFSNREGAIGGDRLAFGEIALADLFPQFARGRPEGAVRDHALLAGLLSALAELGLADSVRLSVEGDVVTATGMVGADGVEAWIAFLRRFLREHGDEVVLESRVGYDADGAGDGPLALTQGGEDGAGPPVRFGGRGPDAIGLTELRAGGLGLGRLFAGEAAPSGRIADYGTDGRGTGGEGTEGLMRSLLESAILARERAGVSGGAQPDWTGDVRPGSGQLKRATSSLLEELSSNGEALPPPVSELARAWSQKLRSTGAEDDGGTMLSTFIRLFLNKRYSRVPCWRNAAITRDNLSTTLFWLDLLHLNAETDLTALSPGDQILLAEAALNPSGLRRCLEEFPETDSGFLMRASVFLEDARTNRRVAERVLRDLRVADLPVLGVSLRDQRVLTLASGERLLEGGATREDLKLLAIGEVGALFGTARGLAVLFYDDDLAWRID